MFNENCSIAHKNIDKCDIKSYIKNRSKRCFIEQWNNYNHWFLSIIIQYKETENQNNKTQNQYKMFEQLKWLNILDKKLVTSRWNKKREMRKFLD